MKERTHRKLAVATGAVALMFVAVIVTPQAQAKPPTCRGNSCHTTTTIASSTTTTSTSTTVSPSTTTSSTSSTSSTTIPTTTTLPSGGAACGLASAAFCETFDVARNGGTRTGDLDPVLWGVSRVGQINPGSYNDSVPQISMSGCGTTAWVFTPQDVRICNGKMFEAVNDGGGVVSLHTYPKQPFNFAGRTGKVVFDVSSDSDGTHGAWPEFIITDKPVPGSRIDISLQPTPHAINEVGFSLAGNSGTSGGVGSTGVDGVFVSRNGVYEDVPFTSVALVPKGNLASLNHFEVRVNVNRIEIWGTGPGGGTLTLLAFADNLALIFTQGLVWLDDVHYNARKAVEPCECGTQWNHTFAWDNLGFDGPKTYRDLGFDVPDANTPGPPAAFAGDPTLNVGYQIGVGPQTFTTAPVRRDQAPTAAQVVFNSYSFASTVPSVSVNGGSWIDTAAPQATYSWSTTSVPVPVAQIRDGTNTLTFKSTDGSTLVANISIILVAAAAVP